MQISEVSLALTWPLRLCLLRVLLGTAATAISFPLSMHIEGGDTAPAFSGLSVYLQFTWEVVLAPSPVEFSSHHRFYKLSCFWLLGVCSCSCLLQLACCEGFPLPPLFGAQGTLPSFATCLFCCYCLLSSFSFFPGWGSVCPGDYADLAQGCLWEYCMLLSSPCLRLPKPSGHWRLAVREPSYFLHLM
jgi:hypothetical protein